MDTETSGCQGLEERGARGEGFLFGVIKMFWNYTMVTVLQPCDYIKNQEVNTLKG